MSVEPLAVLFFLGVFTVGYWYTVIAAEWTGLGPGNESTPVEDRVN
jgi:hypothetical protein